LSEVGGRLPVSQAPVLAPAERPDVCWKVGRIRQVGVVEEYRDDRHASAERLRQLAAHPVGWIIDAPVRAGDPSQPMRADQGHQHACAPHAVEQYVGPVGASGNGLIV
jgi:hypothetical protein